MLDTLFFRSMCSLFKAKCEEAKLPSTGCIVSLGQENEMQVLLLIFTMGMYILGLGKACVHGPVFLLPMGGAWSLDEHSHYMSLWLFFISASLADSHHNMSHFMPPLHLVHIPTP